MGARTKVADIEQLEKDYRAGVPSAAAVARAHGISSSALSQMAKRKGWARDLSAQVKERAKAKATARLAQIERVQDVASNEEIIESASDVQADAILRFRGHVDVLIEQTVAGAQGAVDAVAAGNGDPMSLPAALGQATSGLTRMYAAYRSTYGIDDPLPANEPGNVTISFVPASLGDED